MKPLLTQLFAVPLSAVAFLFWTLPASADLDSARAAYFKGDYAMAFVEYKSLAEKGDAEAQYMLANLYKSGQGVPKDPRETMKWYRKAAALGYQHAQRALKRYSFLYPDLFNETERGGSQSRADNNVLVVLTRQGKLVEADSATFEWTPGLELVPEYPAELSDDDRTAPGRISIIHKGRRRTSIEPYPKPHYQRAHRKVKEDYAAASGRSGITKWAKVLPNKVIWNGRSMRLNSTGFVDPLTGNEYYRGYSADRYYGRVGFLYVIKNENGTETVSQSR